MARYYGQEKERNYKEAQMRIIEAMKRNDKHVLLPGKSNAKSFGWTAIPETITRLKEDGFDIDVVWNPCEYWSIEWGY